MNEQVTAEQNQNPQAKRRGCHFPLLKVTQSLWTLVDVPGKRITFHTTDILDAQQKNEFTTAVKSVKKVS